MRGNNGMALSVCASLMQEAHRTGKDEEECILAAHAYLSGQSLEEHEVEFAMNDVRSMAAKLYA